MVSEYDILYLVGSKGELRLGEIAKTFHREKDYANIRKKVLQLEKEGYVKRNGTVKIQTGEKNKQLFKLILFCINNNISYNFLFKKTVVNFIKKAAAKEYFTIKDIKLHPQTFNLYITTLAKYGFLLIISKKPLVCKLLRHSFLKELLDFFGASSNFYIPRYQVLMPKIVKEMKKFQKLFSQNKPAMSDLEEQEEIKFIHTSLSLEGNPITLSDTEKIIRDEIVPRNYRVEHVQEVTNYKKAVDTMMQQAWKKDKLTLPNILEYHRIAMSHIHGAGEIRKENVRIKGNSNFKTCDWQLISQKLEELMRKYDEFEVTDRELEKVIEFAAFFHNEFQRIHPFIDGNSRTSRLLMLHVLRSHELPVMDFPLGYVDEYMDLTKRSEKRDDETFKKLIEELVFYNLQRANNL